MRVVDVAVRQCYRFNCPNCGSRLEADCGDLVDIGGKTSRFCAGSAGRSGMFLECPKETGCVRGQVRGIGRLLYGGEMP